MIKYEYVIYKLLLWWNPHFSLGRNKGQEIWISTESCGKFQFSKFGRSILLSAVKRNDCSWHIRIILPYLGLLSFLHNNDHLNAPKLAIGALYGTWFCYWPNGRRWRHSFCSVCGAEVFPRCGWPTDHNKHSCNQQKIPRQIWRCFPKQSYNM